LINENDIKLVQDLIEKVNPN